MSFFILTAILLFSVVLCKIIALAIVLLFSALKNIKFKKDSARWDQWFRTMSARKLTGYVYIWYLTAVTVTSAITYYSLNAFQFKSAFAITVLFFLVRFAVSAVRFHKNRDSVLEKLKQDLSE